MAKGWTARDMGDLSGEEAVKRACAKSSYFAGLWLFFDVEVRMCVEPFIDWENGDIEPFLTLFPVMCAYVGRPTRPRSPRGF